MDLSASNGHLAVRNKPQVSCKSVTSEAMGLFNVTLENGLKRAYSLILQMSDVQKQQQ